MEDNTFRVGLCMAGAVSAGAYTAGVMDYLLEALEEWEKQRGQADVPSHKVVIPVIGGASAGGMTGIITASALNNEITPVPVPSGDLMKEHPENRFYNAWVDLLGKDMFERMLSTSDIKKNQVISLLNSQFIDEVARKIVKPEQQGQRPAPPYFEMPLKVFTTLSNLEGYDYNIAFTSGTPKDKYTMTVHNDYACFGFYDTDAQKARIGKGWIPLNFIKGINTGIASDAAMATGAFPVGLKSRQVKRKSEDINSIGWLQKILGNNPVTTPFHITLNVDGGMINNEPFERVRDVLDEITVTNGIITFNNKAEKEEKLAALNPLYETFVNTVLMIDPFPGKEKEPFKHEQGLFKVIAKTFAAVQNQMRVKPMHYTAAMSADASQFLISPSRRLIDPEGKEHDVFGEKAIACGALGGFSGFISKEFRVHDYYLGRFNCEIFLRDYFTVPADALAQNPIFRDGYAGVDKEKFKSRCNDSYQIIPIFSPHPDEDYFPMPVFSSGRNWPVIKEEAVEAFRPKVKDRVQKMLLNSFEMNFLNRFLILAGAKIVLNRMLANKALEAIKGELRDWWLMSKK